MLRSSLLFLLLLPYIVNGQFRSDSLSTKQKKTIVYTSTGIVYTGILVGLSVAWYSDYAQSRFHFFNDNSGWLQIDKFGHTLSSYGYGLAGIEMMKWTGMEKKKAIIIGGLAGTILQTPIEILDGFSVGWGASPGDLIANFTGSALAIGQELLWDEQRFQFKFSYSPSNYNHYRPNVLGDNAVAAGLKDYNGQTYWLSSSPGAFFKDSFWPKWLQLSAGYGAGGLLGAESNIWKDQNGIVQDYSYISRRREYYLTLDIDLTQIKVRNSFLKKFMRTVNLIKVPAPAIRWSPGEKPIYYGLYF